VTMFVVLGFGLAAYVAFALLNGEVVVRSGAGARTVRRAETPTYYWTCVAIYLLLAIALVTVF